MLFSFVDDKIDILIIAFHKVLLPAEFLKGEGVGSELITGLAVFFDL